MAAEEGGGEVLQIVQQLVFRITPVGSEFIAVAGALSSGFDLAGLLFDMVLAGGVAVVFRLGTVADDENLNIFKQGVVGPEGFTAITVDLVEGFFEQHTTTLQFDVYKWKPVHENGHVVAVFLATAIHGILIDDLRDVVVYVFLVDQRDIQLGAIITHEALFVVALDGESLLLDSIGFFGNFCLKETLPLTIGKGDIVQPL